MAAAGRLFQDFAVPRVILRRPLDLSEHKHTLHLSVMPKAPGWLLLESPQARARGWFWCPSWGASEPTDTHFFFSVNPQVILILTKYYHADMGKVLESSLWR